MPLIGKGATVTPPNAAIITYPANGRGAWNPRGVGGTLNAKGDALGPFLRMPATGSKRPMPGLAGYRATRDGLEISIDSYTVHRAVAAIQNNLRLEGIFPHRDDGIWGPRTDEALRKYQAAHGLTADGVFGRVTAKAMILPLIDRYAVEQDQDHAATLIRIMRGTIAHESLWDPAAVGGSDPHDLGLGQINMPSHPTVSPNEAISWTSALSFMADLVDRNLKAFPGDLDAAVAAWNLGAGGARSWVKAGKPDIWTPPGASKQRDVRAYVTRILAGA